MDAEDLRLVSRRPLPSLRSHAAIGVLVVAALGCAGQRPVPHTTPRTYRAQVDIGATLARVRTAPPRTVVELDETSEYSDDRITVKWQFGSWLGDALIAADTHDGMVLTLRNNGATDALKVLWDEAVVSDTEGMTFDVGVTSAPSRIPESAGAAVAFSRPTRDNEALRHIASQSYRR